MSKYEKLWNYIKENRRRRRQMIAVKITVLIFLTKRIKTVFPFSSAFFFDK